MTDKVSTSLSCPNYHFTSFSERDKERARMAAPNGDRCLVSNAVVPIKHCHCIPRAKMKDEKLLNSLEWFWNMKFGSLNLDTRYNIFFADANFHTLFDNLGWLLLPEDYIVDKYWDSLKYNSRVAVRECFPDFPERKTFLYRFVPFIDMEQIVITYRDGIPSPAGAIAGNSNITHYFYPFEKLPLIRSHLHPKFVIYNVGIKLVDAPVIALTSVYEKFPNITKKIEELYGAWIREPPPNAMENPSYNDPDYFNDDSTDYEEGNGGDDPNDSDYSPRTNRTKRGRLEWDPPKKREAPVDPADAGKRRRRKVLSEPYYAHNQPLSKERLSRLNQQFGKATWTDNSIRKWSRKKRKLGPFL